MSNKNMLDISANAFKEIRAWKTVTLILGAVVIFLTYAFVGSVKSTPVVLIPHELASQGKAVEVPLNGDFRGTSQEYLANVALSDLGLALNFTPDNVTTQRQRFLNRLTESAYGTENTKLMAEAADAKEKNITQMFSPIEVSSIEVYKNKVIMQVKGIQIRYLSGKEVLRSGITYKLSYVSYKNYLHLDRLEQTTN